MPARSQSAALPARTMVLLRQMDWYRGLRAAIALCAPLVLGDLLSNSYLAWAALGGFEAIISGRGGRSDLNLDDASDWAQHRDE